MIDRPPFNRHIAKFPIQENKTCKFVELVHGNSQLHTHRLFHDDIRQNVLLKFFSFLAHARIISSKFFFVFFFFVYFFFFIGGVGGNFFFFVYFCFFCFFLCWLLYRLLHWLLAASATKIKVCFTDFYDYSFIGCSIGCFIGNSCYFNLTALDQFFEDCTQPLTRYGELIRQR